MDTYHLRFGDEENGPYDESQVVEWWEGGQLKGATQARRENEEEWLPLAQVMRVVEERKRGEDQQDRWRQQRQTYAAQSSMQFNRDKRRPLLAAFMSILIPGAGHFYSGAPVMGVLWVIGALVTVAGMYQTGLRGQALTYTYFAWGLLSGILAGISAARANQRLWRSLQMG